MIKMCVSIQARKQERDFPAIVRELVTLAMSNRSCWRFLALYLRYINMHDSPETRRQALEGFAIMAVAESERATYLKTIEPKLLQLYSLPSRHSDPRTLVLQLLILKSGPRSGARSEVLYSGCECKVVRRCGSEEQFLGGADATLDTAFLSLNRFEGYECKVKLENFVGRQRLPDKARRKCEFLKRLHHDLCAYYECEVFFAAFDKDVGWTISVMLQNGYGVIRVMGSEEIEKLVFRS